MTLQGCPAILIFFRYGKDVLWTRSKLFCFYFISFYSFKIHEIAELHFFSTNMTLGDTKESASFIILFWVFFGLPIEICLAYDLEYHKYWAYQYAFSNAFRENYLQCFQGQLFRTFKIVFQCWVCTLLFMKLSRMK